MNVKTGKITRKDWCPIISSNTVRSIRDLDQAGIRGFEAARTLMYVSSFRSVL